MEDRWSMDVANMQRIRDVEAAFGTPNKFLQPGRYLIGEGRLSKVCRKKPKARQFFLFNDLLVYGTILINKRKYTNQMVLDLRHLSVTRVDDDGVLQNAWQINTPSKSFVVFSVTPEEKDEWVAHIEKCIKDLRPGFLPQDTGIKAAVWVPDDKATTCMQCGKTKFNAITRRHHCRACGKVVCADCSKEKRVIDNISDKPVRVCTTCAALRPAPAARLPKGALGLGADDRGSSTSSLSDGSTIRARIEAQDGDRAGPYRMDSEQFAGEVSDQRALEEMENLGYTMAPGCRASVFYGLGSE